jgi:hypothetical protein
MSSLHIMFQNIWPCLQLPSVGWWMWLVHLSQHNCMFIMLLPPFPKHGYNKMPDTHHCQSFVTLGSAEWILLSCNQNPVCTLHTIAGSTSSPHKLFLNDSTLLFASAVKFLGLLLDSKLLWEPQLIWLHLKYKQSLNILNVLCGRSWGRDWMVMLWLYHALIHLQIDYGSFTYSSTTKSKLSIIDPVHNTMIQLTTGAFHMSQLHSLDVDSGETSLSLQRYFFLWQSWQLSPVIYPILQSFIWPTLIDTSFT